MLRNWQLTGIRIVRAQERMLHGMMRAAQLEMQFGQEFFAGRMALLGNAGSHETPDRATQELERMMAMLREVNEELRSGFVEATQLLTEESPLQETAARAAEAVAHSEAAIAHSMKEAAARTDAAAQTMADTMKNAIDGEGPNKATGSKQV
ncbi:MAG TPA: hypothetical protein PLY97_09895 [Acidocella sp.]|nr:hypothetical protein [Acidocella sp.]